MELKALLMVMLILITCISIVNTYVTIKFYRLITTKKDNNWIILTVEEEEPEDKIEDQFTIRLLNLSTGKTFSYNGLTGESIQTIKESIE